MLDRNQASRFGAASREIGAKLSIIGIIRGQAHCRGLYKLGHLLALVGHGPDFRAARDCRIIATPGLDRNYAVRNRPGFWRPARHTLDAEERPPTWYGEIDGEIVGAKALVEDDLALRIECGSGANHPAERLLREDGIANHRREPLQCRRPAHGLTRIGCCRICADTRTRCRCRDREGQRQAVGGAGDRGDLLHLLARADIIDSDPTIVARYRSIEGRREIDLARLGSEGAPLRLAASGVSGCFQRSQKQFRPGRADADKRHLDSFASTI